MEACKIRSEAMVEESAEKETKKEGLGKEPEGNAASQEPWIKEESPDNEDYNQSRSRGDSATKEDSMEASKV